MMMTVTAIVFLVTLVRSYSCSLNIIICLIMGNGIVGDKSYLTSYLCNWWSRINSFFYLCVYTNFLTNFPYLNTSRIYSPVAHLVQQMLR